jgi:hypothetical protein
LKFTATVFIRAENQIVPINENIFAAKFSELSPLISSPK